MTECHICNAYNDNFFMTEPISVKTTKYGHNNILFCLEPLTSRMSIIVTYRVQITL